MDETKTGENQELKSESEKVVEKPIEKTEEERDKKQNEELIKESLEQVDLKIAENEILSGEQRVELDSFGTVIIIHPNLKIKQVVENHYSKRFIELLNKSELPTISQLEKTLKNRKIWDDDSKSDLEMHRQILINRTISIQQNKLELNDKGKKPAKTRELELENIIAKLEKERIEAQLEFMNKTMYYNNLLESTIEKKAEKEAIYKQVFLCTQKENEKEERSPLFDSEDDMMSGSFGTDLDQLIGKCISFWEGVQDPILANWLSGLIGN